MQAVTNVGATQSGIVPKAAQPANFAHSKADVLQTLQFYFGDPAYPQKLVDYTEHHAATMHFPDAYVGQSIQLRDTLTNLITEHQQSWMTTAALPWKKIEGLNVDWDVRARTPTHSLDPSSFLCSHPVCLLLVHRKCTLTSASSSACRTRASRASRPRSVGSTASAPFDAASA